MRTVRLREFQRVVFFTGAGMSAESGVPTYRGAGGIWKEYDYRRYACQDAFDRAPEAVWEFHNFRRSIVAACDPNPGHDIDRPRRAGPPQRHRHHPEHRRPPPPRRLQPHPRAPRQPVARPLRQLPN
jgi:hypothetical protein